jgi:hypothetical protein
MITSNTIKDLSFAFLPIQLVHKKVLNSSSYSPGIELIYPANNVLRESIDGPNINFGEHDRGLHISVGTGGMVGWLHEAV